MKAHLTEQDFELAPADAPPASFLGDAPHAFTPLEENPGWCIHCALPRQHRVHASTTGEQP